MVQATATDICIDDVDIDLVGYDPTATAIAANVKQIDDDATAAANSEFFFDGNGFGIHPGRFTISSLSSQTTINIVGGYETDGAYAGYAVRITDLTAGEGGGPASSTRIVISSAYDGGTDFNTITLDSAPGFTIGAGDIVEFHPPTFAHGDRGLIDTEVAAIKAKTDQLNFTVSNRVDSNVTHVAAQSANPVSGNINANVAAISGTTAAADRAEDFFSVGYGPLVLRAAIASVTDQNTFVVSTNEIQVNDGLNGAFCIITDDANPSVKTIRTVSDYTYSAGSATVDLSANAGFTIGANDIVEFLPQ